MVGGTLAEVADNPRKPERAGSMSDGDRALRGLAARRETPRNGVPTPWHEEHTGVHTDTQVFRALKSLHGELQANKAEAAKAHGALRDEFKAEVGALKTSMSGFDEKLDRVAETSARTAGAVEVLANQRSRTPSSETRTVAAAVVTETLAGQVLAERRESTRFGHKVWLLIIGGVVALLTSGAFLGWALGSHGSHPTAPEVRGAP